LPDKAERDKEKEAIMNVNYFRLNRNAYPNRHHIATSFRMVCEAPNQFESVKPDNAKMIKSDDPAHQKMIKAECSDLCEAIEGVKAFMDKGPNPAYLFDNFRGYRPGGQGTAIGRSRFWLSPRGKELSDEKP
jgi:hypothetical protein